MKRIISLGLIVLVVLIAGTATFADEVESTFQRGLGRGINTGDIEPGLGLRKTMSVEAFESYQANNRVMLSLNFRESATIIDILADLTGDSVDTIQSSGLSLHEYAETEGVLETFQKEILVLKEERLNELVEDEIITQEKADFMLERMSQMDGTHPQQRLGQNRSGSGRGFNRR